MWPILYYYYYYYVALDTHDPHEAAHYRQVMGHGVRPFTPCAIQSPPLRASAACLVLLRSADTLRVSSLAMHDTVWAAL